ncbi:MAG: TonB-dependent receptor [Bacteroidia bacterium]|nr:TonB-dependent receptor [Bacteroidia bacterium]
MKKIYSLLIIVFITHTFLYAQMPGGKMPGNIANMINGKLYGKIIDEKTKTSIPYASVTLLPFGKDSIITGVLTKDNGEFLFDNVALGGYRVRIAFIGYKTTEKSAFVNLSQLEKDLGNIAIETDATVLKAAEITEEKSSFTMAVDRKIYNVDKDISTRGGTALDAMKNVPSVTVDADGNAQLRNQTAQIFVDGRPTTLTLAQIPADQIERIEVITNPSVKFDASTVGGILNVVLKKNTKPGYNGMIMGGIGTGNRYNGMVNLNVKQHPFNISFMYSFNTQSNSVNGFTYRKNLLADTVNSIFDQKNITLMDNTFNFGRLGVDYSINNRNTITLAGTIVNGVFDTDDKQNFIISDNKEKPLLSGIRSNKSGFSFVNVSGQILYRYNFPKNGHELTSDLNVNQSWGDGRYDFITDGKINNTSFNALQRSFNGSDNIMYTFQTDYVNPISDVQKVEFGVRSYFKRNHSINNVWNKNPLTSSFDADTTLTNNYSIDDMINAAYGNYSGQTDWFSYQTGLRFEQSYYAGTIVNKNQRFSYSYPNNASNIMKSIFPGLYLSKKFGTGQEVQLNFSRKINRPGFFQLMPFVMFSDQQNIRIGNPQLRPEFTNMAEVNYNLIKGKINWLPSLYLKRTENPITNISYPISPNSSVLINTFVNGSNAIFYGWDNTIKATNIKKLDVTFNSNLFYTYITWNSGTKMLSNSGYSYITKLNLSYKLPWDISTQINGTYEAPKIIPQGTTNPVYFMDFSLNKSIKMKWTINATISDVFNTKKMGMHYETPYYTQDLSRRRETRFYKISVTYIFGKMDSSIMRKFKSMRREGGNQGGNQDGLDFN